MNTILVLAVALVALLLVGGLGRHMAALLAVRVEIERRILKLAEKGRQSVRAIGESYATAFFARSNSRYPLSDEVGLVFSQTEEVRRKHQELEDRTFPMEDSNRPEWYELEKWSDIVSWKVLAFLRLKVISAKIVSQDLPGLEQKWQQLTAQLEARLSELNRIPERIARENHIAALKEKHELWLREAYERGAEKNNRIHRFRVAFEFVQDEIRHFKEGQHPHPASRSAVIRLPDAVLDWEKKVRQIERMEFDPRYVEDRQQAIESLAEDIRQANSTGFALLDIEEKVGLFKGLIVEMKERFTFISVPDTFSKPIDRILHKEIPGHWATGNWKSLEADFAAILKELESFAIIVFGFCKTSANGSIPLDLYEKLETLLPELPSRFLKIVEDSVSEEETPELSGSSSAKPTTSSVLSAILKAERNFYRHQNGEGARIVRDWSTK